MFRRTVRTTALTLLWIPVAYAFTSHVYMPYQIRGSSMTPAFNPGTATTARDVVLAQKYNLKEPDSFERGDIILFKSPLDPEKILTKRVTGLQGETIRPRSPPYPKREVTIPRNHFWVEGDNSMHSIDSNTFGPISQGLVVGKARYIIWPLSRYGSDFSHLRWKRLLSTSLSKQNHHLDLRTVKRQKKAKYLAQLLVAMLDDFHKQNPKNKT